MAHIYFLALSAERGVETSTPNEQWGYLMLRPCLVIPLSNKETKTPWRNS